MDAIDELLTRGVDNIYPTREVLEKVLRSGKKLKLYQGFDPTGIQLHIGHMTGLMKLRQFQKLGHHVIFLIGDGTGQAGDPSGKARSRKKYLSLKDLKENAKDYVMQASKIIDFSGANKAEILYNSDWLNKLDLPGLLDLAGHFSLQYLKERDLYYDREKKGLEINFREFLYPLLQGYDSVAMNVDLELGGSDQMFNMLAGRKLVREYLNKEKYVMTTPLLTDSQGKKIGKTEGNVIALTAEPGDFYGMIMNLPDEIIVKCFEYITDLPMDEVSAIYKKIKSGENPMLYKKKLAYTLTALLNDENAARTAEETFEKVVQKGDNPQLIPEVAVTTKTFDIIDFLVVNGLVKSRSEAKRLVEQGGVQAGNRRVNDYSIPIPVINGMVIKAGKRKFIKILING